MKKIITSLFIVVLSTQINAQVVTTLAGVPGVPGSANGAGLSATFNYPVASVVDKTGNIYVIDGNNHLVRKMTPAGVVSTFAGSGSAGFADGTGTAASFNYPYGIGIDTATGNLYVADYGNNSVRKITPAAVVTTIVATIGFNQPYHVAVDGNSNVYVADFGNNMIRKINAAGVVSIYAGSGMNGSSNGVASTATFNHPAGVAVDANGNVFVSDYNNNLIRKISAAGIVSTVAGSGTAGSVDGPAATASFNRPVGLTLDGNGTIYVADVYSNEIRKISTSGVVSTLAGAATNGITDGTGTAARFYYPTGIFWNGAGNLIVTDHYNHTIRNISVCTPSSTNISATACKNYVYNNQTYTTSGLYVQHFTSTGGCDSTIKLTLTMNPVNKSVSQSGGVFIAALAGASYQWIDCATKIPVAGATSQAFMPTANGSYAAIISNGVCTDTSVCLTITGVGVAATSLANMLNVFPNPATHTVSINAGRQLQNATIRLINVVGQTIIEHNNQNGTNFTYDLSALSNGIYLLEIKEGDETFRTKIVKE